jgi:hypothetical protein
MINMNPTDRLNLITTIALKLQGEQNTTGINVLLSGYGIKTDNVSSVYSKRGYVIDLLKTESIDTIVSIARDMKIDIPESVNSMKSESSESLEKIFISHSSFDSKFVEQIIEMLEAIGVPSEKIFCSSFEGYGVKLGSDFLNVIKDELNSNVLVLFILSSNFYSSVVSLCEMGATWVKTNQHIPILIPPFDYSDIKGVIPTTHGMKINEKEKFNSLKEKVEQLLKLEPTNINVWERKRDKILKEVKGILDENVSTIASNKIEIAIDNFLNADNDSEDLSEKIKKQSKKEWPDDFVMQLDYIQRQNSAIYKLNSHKPMDISVEDFTLIRRKAKEEWPNDFEMQLDYEQKQVESLRRLNKI